MGGRGSGLCEYVLYCKQVGGRTWCISGLCKSAGFVIKLFIVALFCCATTRRSLNNLKGAKDNVPTNTSQLAARGYLTAHYNYVDRITVEPRLGRTKTSEGGRIRMKAD